MSHFVSFQRIITLVVSMIALVPTARGDDWPQILGPSRNGASQETIAAKFPAGGPRVLWKTRVGQGYAGPAVAAGSAYLFHRIDNVERLEAFDVATGKSQWQSDAPAKYRGGIDPDVGPRCVPVVHGERVIVFGAAGVCRAIDRKTGKQLWTRDLAREYEAPDGYFGFGSTPIVLENMVLVNVGGKRAGFVGLDLATGETKWSVERDAASYAAPAEYRRGEKASAIFVSRLRLVEIDPATGKSEAWSDFGRTGPTVNAAVPLVLGRKVFCTSSYGVGAMLIEPAGDGKYQTTWNNDDSLSSQYATPVHADGFLYGIHGREDIPPAHLRCVDAATGKVRWSQDQFGVAHTILAQNRLLLLTIDGELVFAEANPAAYRETARASVAREKTRAIPALAGGGFFFRTSGGDGGELFCLDVAERETKR